MDVYGGLGRLCGLYGHAVKGFLPHVSVTVVVPQHTHDRPTLKHRRSRHYRCRHHRFPFAI